MFRITPLDSAVATVFSLVLFAGIVSSHADAGPWSVQGTYNVPLGQKAKFTFTANQSLKKIKIELKNAAGKKRFKWLIGAIRKGRKKSFPFTAGEGRTQWIANVEGQVGAETVTSSFRFEVVSVGKLDINLSKSGIALHQGRIQISTNRRLAKAELLGFDTQGEQVLEETIQLPDQTGLVVLHFPPLKPETIRRMEIKVYDPFGRWTAFRLVAWYVEIPHDDVVFESGKANVQSAEAQKLDVVVKTIQNEISAFRKTLGRRDVGFDLKLYVAGCTDTVGSGADNLKLSRQRARSIASYFRGKGIKTPIFYEGYGENFLAVPTADNIAEEKNRRAVYILTNTRPSGFDRPNHTWRPL